MKKTLQILILCLLFSHFASAQHSVAREWNEVLLNAIRKDYARPTVHSRNLFHTSVAMYDAWAAYDETAEPFFLGKRVGDYFFEFDGVSAPSDITAARNTAISYACYRLLNHRFESSPGVETAYEGFKTLFEDLGHDSTFVSTDYTTGDPAALGNYIAEQIIAFGFQDNSNEVNSYVNQYYLPYNYTLNPVMPGSGILFDPNRWQPLTFEVFIDQSGNEIPGGAPEFLSPEWGIVTPFALSDEDLTIYERDWREYWVYHDPGAPHYIDSDGGLQTEEYQWGFSLVSVWSAQLDPNDGVMWDISPASIGNVGPLPTTFEGYKNFYNYMEGGDPSQGHPLNPHTGQAYEPQIVPRADYARVLAEFWADGPDSETPPGHWFTVLNYVSDHPLFEKKFKGEGEIVDPLEWDVKAYFILAGAVHDAAVTAWGIKGWYDYIRPISAIRSLAGRGQCSDSTAANFNPSGMPLVDGFIEVVAAGDSLAGASDEHVGKIKVFAWKGPDYIEDEETDYAGVGWILAENWWPYQRPTFVTPPFAGYISGHSTFSRAAAEVMTMLTGDPFFPGGMGEFFCEKNEFLVFEEGPSVDLTLQWATYQDASDQTSLSRIWGGIHPPIDDIPGRIIGEKIGIDAFTLAEKYFNNELTSLTTPVEKSAFSIYPNPVKKGEEISLLFKEKINKGTLEVFDVQGKIIHSRKINENNRLMVNTHGLVNGVYLIKITTDQGVTTSKLLIE